MEKRNTFSRRTWLIIWIVGVAGQLCWNVENQLFNTFIYKKIAPDPGIVSLMVGVSAAVTTISTFLIGTWSDRIGKRKPFVVAGYLIWGVTTVIFGATEFLPKNPLYVAIAAVVGADAVMSFFGSMGNDSGFSTWTTDISSERNRGQLGAAVASQPVIATVIGTIGCAALIDIFDYFVFFVIFGVFVSLSGVFALFFMKDSPSLKPSKTKGFWRQFISVFNFKKLAKNRELLLVVATVATFFISFNVYFPYMLIYFEYTLGFELTIAGILLALPLLLAVVVAFMLSGFINYGKLPAVFVFALVSNICGLLVLQIPGTPAVLIGMFFVGIGYITVFQCMTAWMKNLYPDEQKGQFEGLRIVAAVLLPMVIGPSIGAAIVKAFGNETIISYDYGEAAGHTPSAVLFLFAALIAAAAFVPLYFAARHYYAKRRVAARSNDCTTQSPLPENTALLSAGGELSVAGYATDGNRVLFERGRVRTKLRLKEWDYYHIQNDKFCLQMTIGHVSYIGAVTVYFFDFEGKTKYIAEKLLPMPLGSLKMPPSAESGITAYKNKNMSVEFKTENGKRFLKAKSLSDKYSFDIDVTLGGGGDSLVIATPFFEKNEFYYNHKISCLRCGGTVCINGTSYPLDESCYGLLDWGRGVWPFKNEWFWGSASKTDAPVPYGINIGWGFGDTSNATENMIFYGGKAHKINNVFIDSFDLNAKEWHFTSDDNRLDLSFRLMYNRQTKSKVLWIDNRCDQVFGEFNGTLTLDNGEKINVEKMYGFFENAKNRW